MIGVWRAYRERHVSLLLDHIVYEITDVTILAWEDSKVKQILRIHLPPIPDHSCWPPKSSNRNQMEPKKLSIIIDAGKKKKRKKGVYVGSIGSVN